MESSKEFTKKASFSSSQERMGRNQSYSSEKLKKSISSLRNVKEGSKGDRSTVVGRIMSDILYDVHGGEPSSSRVVKYIMSDMLDNVQEEEAEKQLVQKMPNLAVDKVRAMAFLKKPSPKDGISLYDHLSELLNKILAEKPVNVIEYFEEYSRNCKEERFRPATDHLQDIYIPPDEYEQAKKLMPFLQVATKTDAEEMAPHEEEPTENPFSDLMGMHFYFNQAGIGLPPSEIFLISLAIHRLKQERIITKIRFWGIIFGTMKDYIIAETEVSEEEYAKRNAEFEKKAEEQKEELPEGANMPEEPQGKVPEQPEGEEKPPEEVGGGDARFIPKAAVPETTYKPPPEIPPEKSGEGINKKVYFICNEPGEEWVALPDVTPQQVDTARKIKKFFTGNLNSEIITYPPFPGLESHYLRAQIARISAGTQISPLGFYQFGEEEEEMAEEEEEAKTEYVENPDFEPLPMQDLTDPTMAFWVHHTLPILKQGRTVFWNPKAKSAEEEEEEVEEEEEETKEAVEIEVGPPLLTPLSEDASLETTPPWTVRQSSFLLTESAVAIVRSNIWPGAFAFAIGRKFENMYLGYGHKAVPLNYSPPAMPQVQNEYPMGPEIMEINDPTFEEEEAWRIAHEKKKPEKKEKGEGEEEEEEEEEEEGGEEEEEEEEEDEDE